MTRFLTADMAEKIKGCGSVLLTLAFIAGVIIGLAKCTIDEDKKNCVSPYDTSACFEKKMKEAFIREEAKNKLEELNTKEGK